MKKEILRLLMEQDGFISGQQLCDRLKVSRTAVWKAINQLRKEGFEIEAVSNRGYRLLTVPDRLTEAQLFSDMQRSGLFHTELQFYDEIDSTNHQARRLAEKGASHGTIVVAETQTAGKGRRGRSWVSPAGCGIWMSLILRPEISPSKASMLTLVAALGTAEGLREMCGIDCGIKWPNDLVLNQKKICGILTEMSTELSEIRYVIVGIGINVNTEAFPEELLDKATSLKLETGKTWKRSPLIAAIGKRIEEYYQIFLETQDLSQLREAYLSRLVSLHKPVVILSGEESREGICRGIDEGGELLVELPDGRIETVLSGEVSVRGLYGYV